LTVSVVLMVSRLIPTPYALDVPSCAQAAWINGSGGR
jgi:hypothetical protein